MLLRGVGGSVVDPLDLGTSGKQGVPGLLDAVRQGTLRMVNDPGAEILETPALAAFLSDLPPTTLLGEVLQIENHPRLWLGDSVARTSVLAAPDAWCVRPALDGALPPVPLAAMASRSWRRAIARYPLARRPWKYAANAVPISPPWRLSSTRKGWCRGRSC